MPGMLYVNRLQLSLNRRSRRNKLETTHQKNCFFDLLSSSQPPSQAKAWHWSGRSNKTGITPARLVVEGFSRAPKRLRTPSFFNVHLLYMRQNQLSVTVIKLYDIKTILFDIQIDLYDSLHAKANITTNPAKNPPAPADGPLTQDFISRSQCHTWQNHSQSAQYM